MKLPSISYIVGTHNESKSYIDNLLTQLVKHATPDDEIIVVDDYSTNEETLQALQVHNSTGKIKLHLHALNGDFAAHKNYMNSLATKEYIFNVDADETPHENLLLTLKEILYNNSNVEAYQVPRINIVPDITEEDMQRYGWRFYPGTNYINLPDYQMRVYKNKPEIVWVGRVHETLSGFTSHTALPYLDEEGKVIPDYCLLHMKSRERQVQQNLKYDTMLQK